MERPAFTTALAILLVIAVALLTWQFAAVLLLAFAGLLLSVLLRHLALTLSNVTSLPVGLCLVVVFGGIIAVTVLLAILAGPRVASELMEVLESLPRALSDMRSFIGQTEWGEYLLNFLSREEGGTQWNIVKMLGGTASTTAALFANLVIVFTVAIFLAVDPHLYRRGFLHLVPKAGRARAREVLDTLGSGLWRWLLGQSIDMVAVAIMTGLGLWLIGVPVPLALGLIAGLTNFIPYLGPFLSGIPATLIAFSQSPMDAVYTAGLFLLIQQIEGNLLMPLIQKRATSLPPVLTILAVVALGGLFGLLGALLATPLMLVIIILVRMLYVENVLGDNVKEGP
ncbi:AI-2E family transporter [Roseovarius spongiae]|uniref:AI-2E family transporter n=1 Tax=Roseovarius spongiae TaxID=2320272 RepID=A0A3A8AQG3_9RHOB|nr:AI-2E family transporter [Roseovarius spongiae]RKF12667.1 AI-2E family transporter [Roseovarius spongiae]